MATLLAGEIIEFESVAEFLGHYDSHISKGGFYLDTQLDWELRQSKRFTITIVEEPRRAEFRAEIVFCGGGKVGLEMGSEPAYRKAVAGLVQALRSGSGGEPVSRGPLVTPALKDDGTILYDSAADFLADYEVNFSSGGLYVESARDWPSGRTFSFLIFIKNTDEFDLPIQAKIISANGGLVALQIEMDDRARQGVAEMVELLKELEDEPPEPEDDGQEEKPKATDPVCRGLAYAARNEEDFSPLKYFEIRPDVKPQANIFAVIASVAAAKQPLRIELTSNQITMSFRFKSDGSLVDYVGPKSELDLLDRLLRAEFIDQDLHTELKGLLNPAKPALELLAERKAATRQQVMIALGDQAVDALEMIRAAGEVPFRVFEEEDEWYEGIGFGALITPWLERGLKALPPDKVKGLLKPMWKKALKQRPKPKWPLEDLALDSEGHKFARRLDGHKAINDVVGSFDKRHRDKLFRLAISLRCLGLVDVLQPSAVSESRTQAALADLKKEVELLAKADKFAQAGVHWSAHPDMYQEAMRQLEIRYGRSSTLAHKSKEASQLCQRRIGMAKLALQFLQDQYQRQEYRRSEVNAGLLEESAKLLFHKAQTQIGEDNPRAAIPLLEMAVELDDQPEYRDKLQKVLQHLKKDGT